MCAVNGFQKAKKKLTTEGCRIWKLRRRSNENVQKTKPSVLYLRFLQSLTDHGLSMMTVLSVQKIGAISRFEDNRCLQVLLYLQPPHGLT